MSSSSIWYFSCSRERQREVCSNLSISGYLDHFHRNNEKRFSSYISSIFHSNQARFDDTWARGGAREREKEPEKPEQTTFWFFSLHRRKCCIILAITRKKNKQLGRKTSTNNNNTTASHQFGFDLSCELVNFNIHENQIKIFRFQIEWESTRRAERGGETWN